MPDGSAESFTDDIGWIGCNLEYAASQWSKARQRAANLGIRTIPWIRLCHVEKGEDFETIKQRLSLLMATAISWGENLILPNYENEAETHSPHDVAEYLYGYANWDGETGWSTQAWLPNAVDFTLISDHGDPCLLQIFPTDLRWSKDYATIKRNMGGSVYHARVDKGFNYVGVTYQTYDNATPDLFDVDSFMHSVFPGNKIGQGEWPLWFK